jgi:hypothetical protein
MAEEPAMASEDEELLDTFHELNLEGAVQYAKPTEDDLARLARRAPVAVLNFWRKHGWCSYLNGLLWTTNPVELTEAARDLGLAEGALIVGRSGFGDLFAVFEGKLLTVFVHTGRYSVSLATYAQHMAYGLTNPEDLDEMFFGDTYREAVARDGAPGSSEIFTFEPALALGGSVNLKCIRRVAMKPALDILAQLHNGLVKI